MRWCASSSSSRTPSCSRSSRRRPSRSIDGASRAGQPLLVRFGDATAILLIVAINAVLGFAQERRAEAALAALEKMQTPNARVRRGDSVQVVTATGLVAGDVLELEAGDAVPADARLLQTINLFAEESSLTGESVPGLEGRTRRRRRRRAARRPGRPCSSSARASCAARRARSSSPPDRAPSSATSRRSSTSRATARRRSRRSSTSFGKRILWGCLALSAAALRARHDPRRPQLARAARSRP